MKTLDLIQGDSNLDEVLDEITLDEIEAVEFESEDIYNED